MKKFRRGPRSVQALLFCALSMALAASAGSRAPRASAQGECPGLPPEETGCGGGESESESQCWQSGGYWLTSPRCECDYPYVGPQPGGSPVLLDTDGDGFELTGAEEGVRFDLDGDGRAEQLSWMARGADDALLALDRDGNGRIDNGRELFGNFTPQPPSDERNGFLALAEFDRPLRGGDGDGLITERDAIFGWLRLWRDDARDGVAQQGELHTLHSLGVRALHLDYKRSARTDAHGNEYRYRAKVDAGKRSKVKRWAWDVFFVYAR